MLTITQATKDRFRLIFQDFERPLLPPVDWWRTRSDDDIWIRLVSQVVVVGNATPSKKLFQPEVRSQIDWLTIHQLDDALAAQKIWKVLREIGARYTSATPEACRKTKALLYNLEVLKNFDGGPRGFLHSVATHNGTSQDKVDFVSKHFRFVKNKGARDFLISGFGIVRNHIAFDIRIKQVLNHLGIQLPPNFTSDATLYAEVERDVDEQVCHPNDYTLAELDQLLFLNHKKILEAY